MFFVGSGLTFSAILIPDDLRWLPAVLALGFFLAAAWVAVRDRWLSQRRGFQGSFRSRELSSRVLAERTDSSGLTMLSVNVEALESLDQPLELLLTFSATVESACVFYYEDKVTRSNSEPIQTFDVKGTGVLVHVERKLLEGSLVSVIAKSADEDVRFISAGWRPGGATRKSQWIKRAPDPPSSEVKT